MELYCVTLDDYANPSFVSFTKGYYGTLKQVSDFVDALKEKHTNADYWSLIEKTKYMLNAGVDINGFAPVTFDEMLENNEKFKGKAATIRY